MNRREEKKKKKKTTVERGAEERGWGCRIRYSFAFIHPVEGVYRSTECGFLWMKKNNG